VLPAARCDAYRERATVGQMTFGRESVATPFTQKKPAPGFPGAGVR